MKLLSWRDTEAPGVEAVITDPSDASAVQAEAWSGNPLDDDWRPPDEPTAHTVLMASGALPAMGDDSNPMTWLGPGREALDHACARISAPLIAQGRKLLLIPHCRHVLSDAPSCVAFLEAHAEAVGIALSPARLIESTMLADIDDHIDRILEMLGSRIDMLILEDVQPTEAGGRCEPSPWGEGCVDWLRFKQVMERCVGPEMSIVAHAACIDAVRAWGGGCLTPANPVK